MNKVTELENKIKYYAQKYYEGNPEVSDEVFDGLISELRELNPDSEVLNKTGWGYEPKVGEKFEHKYQEMGSLPKTREWKGIPDTFKDGTAVCISQKLDGLSAVAYYEDGNFVQGLTRGNGRVGIDITDKMSGMVPSYIEGFTGAVRGELIIPVENWKTMKESNPDLISSRNTAAGIINRKEITDDLRYVHFCVYKVVGCTGELPFKNVLEMREFLKENFIHTVTTEFPVLESEDFWNLHSEYTFERMKEKGYEIDGLVLTKNNFSVDENEAVIYTEYAYKFKSETANVEVLGIEWNLSRLGALKPVVLVEPTELSGCIIKRVTANNARYVVDNKIKVGSRVRITRSGEVIPYIIEVLS